MSVDTLSLAKQLRAAELPAAQADAIAAAIGGAVTEGIATKADLELLRGELRQVEGRLEARFDAKIEQLRSSLLTYFIATILSLAAVIVAVVKL